ncbi:hypothetical protein ACFLIN_00195 [Corynebacterium kutscheri]|uniref:Magnesium/cobalt transporter CorA n=1 Tax=Corynebacterium kutscheri TaxID=35755 RepID=A0AB38VU38_9CORY|nr:hypothetical protein [Corynebacterium kutscheri]VEH08459.1 magnesium/cobalt transporter CorA [Corynebacterium kutscheri]
MQLALLDSVLRLLIDVHQQYTTESLRNRLGDVRDHAIVARDAIHNFDERLSSLIDAAVAKISLQQNNDM